jgi:putative ABC transport system permease protein
MRAPPLLARCVPRAVGRSPRMLLSVGFALVVVAGAVAPLVALLARSAERAGPYTDPPFRGTAPPGWLPRWTDEALSIAQVQDAALGTLLQLTGVLVVLLLAVALVNLVTLSLAHGTARQHEAVLRAVLGATRARLLRQWIREAAVVALPALALGAALGVGVSRGLETRWPHAAPPWLGTAPVVGPHLVVIGLALAAMLLAWLSPVRIARRRDLRRHLTTGGHATAGRGEMLLRNALVVLQIAASLVLLMSAGLLLRGFVHPPGSAAQGPGFDPRDTLALRVELPADATAEQRAAAYASMLQRVAAVPGVVDTSLATTGLWAGLGTTDRVTAVCGECRIGMMAKPINQGPAQVHAVSPGHFGALGATLTRGREFDADDRMGSAPVAVINRTFAFRLFPNGEPIGKRVQLGGGHGDWYTVVGIVADVRAQGIGVGAAPERVIYLSALQHPPHVLGLAVRTHGAPLAAAPVQRAVLAAAPDALVGGAMPMAEYLDDFRAPLRWFGLVLSAVALLSLLLAATGLHGVMRDNVERRVREIGVRMALGTTRRAVVHMVLRQAAQITGLGTILGLWGALSVARLLQLWFHGVALFDPLLFAALSLGLAGITLTAAYGPANRAARVDPMISLRAD